jgi:hypothetical protein
VHGTHGTTGVAHSSGLSLAEKAKLKLTGHL